MTGTLTEFSSSVEYELGGDTEREGLSITERELNEIEREFDDWRCGGDLNVFNVVFNSFEKAALTN